MDTNNPDFFLDMGFFVVIEKWGWYCSETNKLKRIEVNVLGAMPNKHFAEKFAEWRRDDLGYDSPVKIEVLSPTVKQEALKEEN